MNWKLILKNPTKFPTLGTYRDWKGHLRREADFQCVYCCIHESSFGGLRNYHVEHYKPKSVFNALENDYNNLFYACAICNVFKGDDWPGSPQRNLSNISYPCPSTVNYSNLFNVDISTGELKGKYIASKYVVEKLFLNRPQLIIERKLQLLYDDANGLRKELMNLEKMLVERAKNGDKKAIKYFHQIFRHLDKLMTLQDNLRRSIPYGVADISR
jgi:hypothetical protein